MEIIPVFPKDEDQENMQSLQLESTAIQPALNEAVSLPGSYFSYEQPEEDESAINLRELWRRVWRRKWLVLTIVFLVTSIVVVEVMRAKSIYQATATIEIQQDQPSLVKTADYIIQTDEYELKTALFLLQSRPLLEDVAESLKLDKNPKFLESAKNDSLWGKSKEPADLKSDGGEANEEAEVLKLNIRKRTREDRERLAPFVGILSGGLSVDQLKETRLINVSFKHTDPDIAALVANGIAQCFIERVFSKKTEKFSHTSVWLNRSTRELEAQMQKAEQDLADYSRTHNIFTNDAKEDLTITKLAHLHDQMMRAETDRMLKQSLYDEVKQGRVAQLPEAFANTSTAELQKKLSELTVLVAQMSVKFGSTNPKVIETRQQMEAIQQEIGKSRSTLEEKLKADYERALRDENSLREALDTAKAEAVQQNQTAVQYNILNQNVETAKSLYKEFLQKTRQADIEMAEQSRNVSVAQPAEAPGGPIGPLRFRAILLAFILSLAGSIGLVFLLDHLDNRIKTVDDVNRYVRLPALGVIPTIDVLATRRMLSRFRKASLTEGGNAQLISLDSSHTSWSVAEAYRMLRTSVLLAAAGRPPKTILVTSSQPGEGKTTTTINTSICLAHLGAKVILIDADMRRPHLHKIFGLKYQNGLSTYLSNEVDLATLIQPTGVANLSVMTSGLIPPNSADLLGSEKMRQLLRSLAETYDHVMVDSPPVTSVTDPVILSRLVDGVILVVHGGKISREMVRHTRTELSNVGAKIFGVVLNNVNLQRDGYDYYHHRYQYEYGRGKNDRQ